MKTIRNGSKFTMATKRAALKASKAKANKNRTLGAIAEDFGVARVTLSTWKRLAGISAPQPAQLATYQATQASTKAYNTPTPGTENGLTVIAYRGVVYR